MVQISTDCALIAPDPLGAVVLRLTVEVHHQLLRQLLAADEVVAAIWPDLEAVGAPLNARHRPPPPPHRPVSSVPTTATATAAATAVLLLAVAVIGELLEQRLVICPGIGTGLVLEDVSLKDSDGAHRRCLVQESRLLLLLPLGLLLPPGSSLSPLLLLLLLLVIALQLLPILPPAAGNPGMPADAAGGEDEREVQHLIQRVQIADDADGATADLDVDVAERANRGSLEDQK